MNSIQTTEQFDAWFRDLRDQTAKQMLLARIRRAGMGNFGDCKPVGDGVSEMRIDVGQGYRVYFARVANVTYLLLNGGDKSTQKSDIKRAKAMWREIQKQ